MRPIHLLHLKDFFSIFPGFPVFDFHRHQPGNAISNFSSTFSVRCGTFHLCIAQEQGCVLGRQSTKYVMGLLKMPRSHGADGGRLAAVPTGNLLEPSQVSSSHSLVPGLLGLTA